MRKVTSDRKEVQLKKLGEAIRESAARVNAVFDSWSDAFGALKEDIRAPDGKNKDVL